jgi:hypothetical protein
MDSRDIKTPKAKELDWSKLLLFNRFNSSLTSDNPISKVGGKPQTPQIKADTRSKERAKG